MKMEKIMKLRRIMTEYYYYPMRGRGGTWWRGSCRRWDIKACKENLRHHHSPCRTGTGTGHCAVRNVAGSFSIRCVRFGSSGISYSQMHNGYVHGRT
jgi:hypothetical protein